jgi:xanthine dehydrogenase small subunit
VRSTTPAAFADAVWELVWRARSRYDSPVVGAFLVNGRTCAGVEPLHVTLLDFLRARGLTAAKEGCAEGECGACAVLMVMPHGEGSAYRAINSCLMLLASAAGGEFYTAESLTTNPGGRGPRREQIPGGRATRSGDERLCDAQAALAAAGGSQCGYCTPGFVMSLFAEQYRPDRVGPCDVLAMAGNLCRCTGYRPIRDAALALGPAPGGEWLDRLSRPAPVLHSIVSPGFSRPRTVDECVSRLASNPEARLLAGGTDVAVESNLNHDRPAHLISVEAIDELRTFVNGPKSIVIGAALPLTEIGARWIDAPHAVREWLDLFGSPLIRHRATLGGNLATASPIGDAAPLLLALGATVHLAGAAGRRAVPLSTFFAGYRRTVLGAGELITSVEIPRPLPQDLRFYKIAKRRLDDISTVAAAMALDRDASGLVRRARFAFGGVAATPVRLTRAEDAIAGRPWSDAVGRVQQVIETTLTPLSDHRGSREYRLDVSKRLVEKFAWEIG